MKGYNNKIVWADLSSGEISIRSLPEQHYRDYVGGAGVGARLLYDETGPATDPLGPDNLLAAFAGPWNGTAIPGSGRHHMVARSPQTCIFGESNVGGSWSVRLKGAGFDGVVVKGRAEKPVYLWIHDDKAELRPADELWGKDTMESAAALQRQTRPGAAVAVTGPAGENQCGIAGVLHICTLQRMAGRTGLGAVMGSKNLKAMVAYGTKPVEIAQPELLSESLMEARKKIMEATKAFSAYGTPGGVENYERLGNFPLQNWKLGRWDKVKNISGIKMFDSIKNKRVACMHCPIACSHHLHDDDSPFGAIDAPGPEYESLGTLGGLCLIDDLPTVIAANDLCNRYGLDTISTGSVIAFAMEAYERGVIGRGDCDGLELVWGNKDVLLPMIHKIGRREGVGDTLSFGVRRAAEILGHNSSEYAVHVKGLEAPAHDPRRFFTHALSYATGPRGACHNVSSSHSYEMAMTMPEIGIDTPLPPYSVDGNDVVTTKLQNVASLQDSLVCCRFISIGRGSVASDWLSWHNMVTGNELDMTEFLRLGERIFNLKRIYNTRLGLSRKDDQLPSRFTVTKREGEGLDNQLPPMGLLLSNYYKYRGWDDEGIPSKEKLAELDLKE